MSTEGQDLPARHDNPYEAPRDGRPLGSARSQVILFRSSAALFLGSAALVSLIVALLHLGLLLMNLSARTGSTGSDGGGWSSFPLDVEDATPRTIVAAGLRLSAGLLGALAALASRKGRWWITLWTGLFMSGLILLSGALTFDWIDWL